LGSSYFFDTGAASDQTVLYEGVVVLKDLETFSSIEGTQVIIFNEGKNSSKVFSDLEDTKDVDIAFNLALEGQAEVVSIEKLVDFYLSNN
jgi:hypothetical protein